MLADILSKSLDEDLTNNVQDLLNISKMEDLRQRSGNIGFLWPHVLSFTSEHKVNNYTFFSFLDSTHCIPYRIVLFCRYRVTKKKDNVQGR